MLRLSVVKCEVIFFEDMSSAAFIEMMAEDFILLGGENEKWTVTVVTAALNLNGVD